ncbi:MAG: hypothetical protein ACXQT5_03060 [Candidatus Syntropharchaeia archaeon]
MNEVELRAVKKLVEYYEELIYFLQDNKSDEIAIEEISPNIMLLKKLMGI